MSLADYRRKRSFTRTGEPEPGRPAPRGRRPLFVVQLHHASRRHYDFRLQVGDALRSWAVPKGPSYDPKVKRMAVEVEDHPLGYADFEGQIPRGEYGGGHVARFDQGVWSTDGDPEAQLAKGHLRFELFGRKLKGGWHLVRSGKPARQPQWLLFKDEDAYAGPLEADDLLAGVTPPPAQDRRRAGSGKATRRRKTEVKAPATRRRDWAKAALALPGARKGAAPDGAFAPQLARLVQAPPEGADWLHELKWDGYRLLATIADGQVWLWSRNGLDWTGRVPEVRDALGALGLRSAVLDGELVAGRGARTDFNLLQAVLSGERQARLVLVLFDLLHLDGVDLAGVPLRERKALLRRVLDAGHGGHLAYSSHAEGEGGEAFRVAGMQGFEGIVSKRGDRPYRPGRSDDWRKTKLLESDEFAVVGFTAPRGTRTGFGSLLLARPDPEHGWRYAGKVGSGFSEAQLRELAGRLGKGSRAPSVFVDVDDPELRRAAWIEPELVVEVFYRGIGAQQVLRQPSLKALRPDKRAADLSDPDRGPPGPGSTRMGGTKRATAGRAAKAASPGKRAGAVKKAGAARAKKAGADKTAAPRTRRRAAGAGAPPELSSPGKVLYPGDGYTKADVWNYYQTVMDQLLPQIAGRPLSVIRCPGGIARACFFQKHRTAGLERVATVRLKEESGGSGDYLVVEDAAGLMELVQFNTLEFHPWGAHADAPDTADRVVFDLDPGPDVPFAEVKRAAQDLRRLLARLELESFLRVSGGKGLHVVVPLNPGCDWALTRRFARGFAEALAQAEPDRFLAVASKRLRNRRIFIDYLRNGRGATAVASYSLRARPRAPVAMPIGWNELARLARPDAFTLASVPEKLRRRRRDPWEGMDRIRQDLARWADAGA